MRTIRHIITPEYPPQCGGVSDYVRLVANGLTKRGEEVHVWAPGMSAQACIQSGVVVHRAFGTFSLRDFARIDRMLDTFAGPRKMFVQWVPHGYGWKSMNVLFCRWLFGRSRRGDEIEVMVHEPFHAFGEGNWKQNAAAAVHRPMIAAILNSAQRVWIAIPAWEQRIRPYLFGRSIPVEWLPVPSNIAPLDNPMTARVSMPPGLVIGHFGTFGRAITSLVTPMFVELLASTACAALFIGSGSIEYRDALLRSHPEFAGRIEATGEIDECAVSAAIRACDVMVQPYPDGVSSRRGTAMAAISHGKPLVTTHGRLSEPIWREHAAVALAGAGDCASMVALVLELIGSEGKRADLGARARRFYDDYFDIRHTIDALTGTAAQEPAYEGEGALCEF